jgi:hypothetical protein
MDRESIQASPVRQDATSRHQTDGRNVAGTAGAAGRDTDPDNSMAMTRATRSFLHDTIQAVQAVGRRPALAAAAIGMLGLGIGATTVIFSLVHGVLVRPLPWPGADRIVQLREYRDEDRRGWRFAGLTNETFDAWQRSAATIEQLSAWSSRGVTLSGRGDPVRLRVVAVTPSLFGPTDAATLGAVSAAVVLAALAAAILPARRAARVDPVHALRS